MSHACHLCDKTYVWLHDLKRHVQVKHQEDDTGSLFCSVPSDQLLLSQQSVSESPGIFPQQKALNLSSTTQPETPQVFQFLHPFTLMVSGPSCCGKTFWVKNMLKSQIIHPRPQRIVWCYGQWQVAYENMKKTLPGIEFVQGIPNNLEEDDYFDSNCNNVIVLDDLMSEAKNDPKVANLFTRGSHHRSLSVCALFQNALCQGKASRDIFLNSQYLVLFNNPIDRHQISLIGRRIYPTKSDYFMKTYEKAVSHPFGYLLIDLKAHTLEKDRLRTNVLPGEKEKHSDITPHKIPLNPVSVTSSEPSPDSQEDDVTPCQVVQPSYRTEPLPQPKESVSIESKRLAEHLGIKTNTYLEIPHSDCEWDSESSDQTDVKMPTCLNCGLVFNNDYNLQHHIKRWCHCSSDEEDEPAAKKSKAEDVWLTPDEHSPTCDNESETEGLKIMWELAREANQEKWQGLVETYMKDVSQKVAEKKADRQMEPKDRSVFFNSYAKVLYLMHYLQDGPITKKLLSEMEDLDEDKNLLKAVRKLVRRFAYMIDLPSDNDSSDNSRDESTSDSDQD